MRAGLILSCLPAFVSCGVSNSHCNSFLVVPALIAVTNAATDAPICDAQVTASGSDEFTLTPSSTGGGPCQYTGPGIIGPFTITVSKVGFQTATLIDVNATI